MAKSAEQKQREYNDRNAAPIDRSKYTTINPFTVPGKYTIKKQDITFTTHEELDYFLKCMNPRTIKDFRSEMKDVMFSENIGSALAWSFI